MKIPKAHIKLIDIDSNLPVAKPAEESEKAEASPIPEAGKKGRKSALNNGSRAYDGHVPPRAIGNGKSMRSQ